jgi:hypothetical protein
MNIRLLSFLSDFQNAILADNPAMDDAHWDMQRTVNYQLGLARLKLSLGIPGQPPQQAGEIMLQGFSLADGVSCVKAVLRWSNSSMKVNRAVYERADTDWKREARKMAADWNAGAPAEVAVLESEPLKPLSEQVG